MITYLASDYFMVRNSLLTLKDYENIFSESRNIKDNLGILFNQPSLSEALIVASRSLSKAFLSNGLDSGGKASEQIIESLLKYSIRLSTRPTPFGLFSGISKGRFGSSSEIVVSDISKHSKRARPDMEWLYGFIKSVETNSEIRRNLRVRFNDFSYVNGNRINKPDKTLLQQNEIADSSHELTSIRYTRLVKRVEEICSMFCKYSEVVSILRKENGIDENGKVELFLNELLENEYLITELRPPLSNVDALDYIINVLTSINDIHEVRDYLSKLLQIKETIAIYNSTSIGNGINEFNEIVNLMSKLFVCENYLQVDMKVHTRKNVLDIKLKDELNNFVAAMHKIAPFSTYSGGLEQYKTIFVEKYGYNVEVAVLELLDDDIGLGFPAHYKTNNSIAKKQLSEKNINSILSDKILLALKNGKKEVEITDRDIDSITTQEKVLGKRKSDFPQSFELYFLVHPGIINTYKECDYHFSVAPAIASGNVGRTFGRFRDMLSIEESAYLKEDIDKQKQFLSNYIIAEITELPSKGRLSNVSINESDYDYQICLSTNHNERQAMLSIRDLYIGVDSESNTFYISSKSLNKKVIVTTTNMVNPLLGSGVLRFLREVSSIYKVNPINSITSIINNSFVYSPRITYGKVIIKPETWNITRQILDCIEGDYDDKIIAFKDKYQMPQYVFLNEADKRLLLDLENREHRNIIYNTLKGSYTRTVILTEIGCKFDDFMATDEHNNHYVTEIVVPFSISEESSIDIRKRKEIIHTNSNISHNSMMFNKKEAMILPCNQNWLYFKIYGCNKRHDELVALMYDKLQEIVPLLQKYFYINYADPAPHIRLRLHTKEGMLPKVLINIMEWFENLRIEGLVSKVTIESYIKEVERYGGLKLIDLAEDCFFDNSRLAMEIIKRQRYGKQDFNVDNVGVAFIIFMLDMFGLTEESKADFLYSVEDRKSYRKSFQKERKTLMNVIDRRNWYTGDLSIYYKDIFYLIDTTAIALEKYISSIFEHDKRGELTNSIDDIIRSLIHMFCNRLVGDNKWENKIYILSRHSYYAFQCYKDNV